jgi:hypothetical protein
MKADSYRRHFWDGASLIVLLWILLNCLENGEKIHEHQVPIFCRIGDNAVSFLAQEEVLKSAESRFLKQEPLGLKTR